MGLLLSYFYALFMISIHHSASAKLVSLDGIQQKDLITLKPREVNDLITGLQLVAQVVGQKEDGHDFQNGVKPETSYIEFKGMTGATHKKAEYGPVMNSTTGELPPILNQIRQGRSAAVNDVIKSMIEALRQNGSNSVYITNFASRQTNEHREPPT